MHCAPRESETAAEEVPFSGERAIARHLHIKRLLYKIEKEELPMCKAFEELMKEERLAGRKEGKREGKRDGKREERFLVIGRMIKRGFDEGQIRELTNCTRKEFMAVAGKGGVGNDR